LAGQEGTLHVPLGSGGNATFSAGALNGEQSGEAAEAVETPPAFELDQAKV
jgi:hypothetical protein